MERILFLAAFPLLFSGCAESRMVPLVPCELVWEGDPIIRDAPKLADSDSYIYQMMAVLVCYGEDFEYKGGRLLISRKLAMDKELLANYDKKAGWISERLRVTDDPLVATTQPTKGP